MYDVKQYSVLFEADMPKIDRSIRFKVMLFECMHSEKKGYQNGAPGVLLLQMVPFFQRGTLFSLISMFMEKRVPK